MVPDATVFTWTELAGLDRLPRRRSLKVVYEFRMLPALRIPSKQACQELWAHTVTIAKHGDRNITTMDWKFTASNKTVRVQVADVI